MILKKKNIQQQNRLASKLSWSTSGLFSSKTAKENLVEQLKKGTLFNLDLRHSEDKPKPHHSSNAEQEHWLNQITLGYQDQTVLTPPSRTRKQQQRPPKQLPCIETIASDLPQVSPAAAGSKRCDKMTCFQKKLKTTGAWNKKNPNRIEMNLARLASTLKTNHKDLTTNDFQRVPGYKDRSFDQSIMSASADLSGFHTNPFGNITFGEASKWKRRDNRFWRSIRSRKWPKEEGNHVPDFLMTSLLVEAGSKAQKG